MHTIMAWLFVILALIINVVAVPKEYKVGVVIAGFFVVAIVSAILQVAEDIRNR